MTRAQDRAGRACRAETTASALHDAARRAGSETLDLRLDRVLPLMAELYGRLRPHPVWQDIEYSIRGDLRRRIIATCPTIEDLLDMDRFSTL